jgi:competence protein ComEA
MAAILIALTLVAQQLPEAPAKKTVAAVCAACHDLDTAIAMRHSRTGWQAVVDAMINRGARATDAEFGAIVEYLAKYFGTVNVNTAEAREIADVLGISPAEADAIVHYRSGNGEFMDIEGLKKVPGLNASLIEERKDRVVFK